jgi:hypothetical protein
VQNVFRLGEKDKMERKSQNNWTPAGMTENKMLEKNIWERPGYRELTISTHRLESNDKRGEKTKGASTPLFFRFPGGILPYFQVGIPHC